MVVDENSETSGDDDEDSEEESDSEDTDKDVDMKKKKQTVGNKKPNDKSPSNIDLLLELDNCKYTILFSLVLGRPIVSKTQTCFL